METKEFEFQGMKLNGIFMIIVLLLLFVGAVSSVIYGAVTESGLAAVPAVVLLLSFIIGLCGFVQLEPNEMSALLFFGKYRGSLTRNGLYWVNPFLVSKKMTLRARNLDGKPIKVNDKDGNPILIGLVVVWRLKDAYKALFEVDLQEKETKTVNTRMNALERFVSIQSDAALRQDSIPTIISTKKRNRVK